MPHGPGRTTRLLGRASLLLSLAIAAACQSDAPEAPRRSAADDSLLQRILIADDARALGDAALPLKEGLASANRDVRVIAVRSLGRLRSELVVPELISKMADPDTLVRRETANALAESVVLSDPSRVRQVLLSRLGQEENKGVRAAVARSLGRLRLASADEATAAALAIVDAAGSATSDVRTDFVFGIYAIASQRAAAGAITEPVLAWLRDLARSGLDSSEESGRARALAVTTLTAVGRLTLDDITSAYGSEDEGVRRQAIGAIATQSDLEGSKAILQKALSDPSPRVRYQALVLWVNGVAECGPIMAAAHDADPTVAVTGVDGLAKCFAEAPALALLDSLVTALPASGDHRDFVSVRAAHAMTALARVDSVAAVTRAEPFRNSPNWVLRLSAVRAAALSRDMARLRMLERDPDPNVKIEALRALRARGAEGTTPLLIEALSSDDPSVVIEASELLAGSPSPVVAQAAMDALRRFSNLQPPRETTRTVRLALIDRLIEVGVSGSAAVLRELLDDPDPEIANRASVAIKELTGQEMAATPKPLPREPVPTPAQLDSLAAATFRVEMEDGRSFDVQLFAWEAPGNSARFAKLVSQGYYNGLSFHRVVPNFVVQGGSPGANEYATGVDRFSRDELGLLSQTRGTLGVSTRGPDTGDAQFYVNLVDNPSLDHQYTVFGRVSSGMDVVDEILQGALIKTITVVKR